jgi:uncharacterized membrane protein YozB (DUF420 family)
MLHIESSFIVILLLLGVWFRKRNSRVHFGLMLTAFSADLLLVIYIEVMRHAVEKVVTRGRPMIWFHAGVSLAVLACYGLMIYLGRPMLAGDNRTRGYHRRIGMAFLVLRGLNYVTSYMIV